MRTFEAIFIAAAFAVAIVASDDAIGTEALANYMPDESLTILSCLRGRLLFAADMSRNNTETFLRKLSPKDKFDETWTSLKTDFDVLRYELEVTNKVVLDDFDRCVENNKKSLIPRNCHLLAKLSYTQRNAKLLAISMAASTKTLVEACVKFNMENIVSNVMSFMRERNALLLGSLTKAVGCFTKN